MKVKDETVRYYRARYKIWFSAFIQVAVLGGASYGWSGLEAMLQRAGYWAIDQHTEEKNYGLLYTVGVWFNLVGRPFFGIYLDWFGIRVTTVTGFIMSCAGLTMLAISNTRVNLLYPAFILISSGGPAILLATQSVSKLFRNRAMVISSLIAAFQLSTVWFMLLNWLNQNGIWAVLLYVLYAAVAGCLGLWCYFFYPTRFSLFRREDEGRGHGYGVSRKSLLITTGRYAADFLEKGTIWQMMSSVDYVMLNIWWSCYILYLDFYIMTLQTQAQKMTGKTMSLEFSICVWTFSIYALAAGYSIDKFGFGGVLLVNILFSVSALMLLNTSSVHLQTVGCIMHVLSRVTTCCIFFSYIGINFGFKYFGTLAGVALLFSGFFSLFQYLLLDIVEYHLEDNYREMNLFLAIWCSFWGGIFAFFLLGMEARSSKGKSGDSVKYREGKYVIGNEI